MAGLSISISSDWVKKLGNCEPCKNCEDLIYGNRYNLEITIANKTSETKISLCESCYFVIVKTET